MNIEDSSKHLAAFGIEPCLAKAVRSFILFLNSIADTAM